MSNFLTFDIEEWHRANYHGQSVFSKSRDSSLMRNVGSLLDLCDEHQVKSTCFILGCVAQNTPEVVRLVFERGHEVASHGFDHELVYKLTPLAFREDVVRTKALLEDIAGEEVRGYRAPSWSVTEENKVWFYDILADTGHLYSSSVYPGRTHLFGIPSFPDWPHFPNLAGRIAPIPEIPHAMTRIFGKKIAFGGGFFLRLLPVRFIRSNIRRTNQKGVPVFLYLHPREIDPNLTRLKLGYTSHFIHYYNVANTRIKLSRIMSGQQFILMKDYCDIYLDRISQVESGSCSTFDN